MKRILFSALLIWANSGLTAQSIKELDFLLGTWDLHEVIFAGTDREYVETGVRECSYYLGNSYIKCESNAIRKGKERSYTFLFNYDEPESRFRLLKLSSDYSFLGIKSWKIDSDLQTVLEEDLTGELFISNISIADKNKLIWRGWEPKNGKDPQLELIFTEVATRR